MNIRRGEDKDAILPRLYWPICFPGVLGKLEKLLAKRLQARPELPGLHLNQYGFREDRSKHVAIYGTE